MVEQKEVIMLGIVQFIKSILKLAIILAIAGNLVDVTRIMLDKSVKAHQHRGISFVKMNQMLFGKPK